MGNFLGSIQIKSSDFNKVNSVVQKISSKLDKPFYVSQQKDDWIAIFPPDYGQDSTIIDHFAEELPEPMFHILVHDDDVFCYYYYRNGELIDQYNSNPDYFGEEWDEEEEDEDDIADTGNPNSYSEFFRTRADMLAIKDILKREETPQIATPEMPSMDTIMQNKDKLEELTQDIPPEIMAKLSTIMMKPGDMNSKIGDVMEIMMSSPELMPKMMNLVSMAPDLGIDIPDPNQQTAKVKYPFASQRMQDFADILKIPYSQYSYEYLEEEDFSQKEIPGLTHITP